MSELVVKFSRREYRDGFDMTAHELRARFGDEIEVFAWYMSEHEETHLKDRARKVSDDGRTVTFPELERVKRWRDEEALHQLVRKILDRGLPMRVEEREATFEEYLSKQGVP